MMPWTDLLGLLAGALTTAAFIPQVIKIYATKSGNDISLGMFLIFTAGVTLWLLYGLVIDSAPLIIANVITLALALTIIVLKLRYARRRHAGPTPR